MRSGRLNDYSSGKTVLFVSHKEKQCGVYQFGFNIAQSVKKSRKFNFVYKECSSVEELASDLRIYSPSVVIFNYYNATTMSWVNQDLLGSIRVPHVSILHEVSQERADALNNSFFKYYIAPDPTLLLRNPIVFKTGRLIPHYENPYLNPKIPTIGSFGFGFMNKGFDRMVQAVQNEFDEAIIRIQMPFAAFGDKSGQEARRAAEICRKILIKPGIELKISHDFLSQEQILDFLAQNSLNAFFYSQLANRGISSALDLALAVKRPITISNSHMFRHMMSTEPSICIDGSSLKEIMNQGIQPLVPYYQEWKDENLIWEYERIIGKILEREESSFRTIGSPGTIEEMEQMKSPVEPVRLQEENGKRIDVLIQTAKRHLQEGRLELAEPLSRAILEADSNNTEAMQDLGFFAFQQRKYELAAEYFLKAIALKPDNPVLLNNAGVALYELGRLEEAKTFYELALTNKPEYAEAHCNRGIVYRDQGDLAAALECFKTALRLKPDYVEAQKQLDGLKISQVPEINKKIAFIDCEFHRKTRSTHGLIDVIKKHFQEVGIYWDGGSLDFQKIADQHYDTVIFFQQIYGARRLKALNTKNIILIPMYDDVREIADSYWKQFSQVKFLNFSKKLHHKLLQLGLNSTYIQYYVPVSNLPTSARNAGGLSAFFWQRTNRIRWSTIKTLIQDSSFKDFHIHFAMDPPGSSFEKPSNEDIKKYKILISDWFPNQEEYLNLLNSADVFFAPRLYEGIGMSFLEAMAMGKCVVAPNLPTMNEYIRHGETGLLYDPENPVPLDFSQALEIGENARRSVEEGYRKWKEGEKGLIQFINEP